MSAILYPKGSPPPRTWWPNRKSALGLRHVVASAPPKLPDGREWWCVPPTAMPEPSHIEYVEDFMRELLARPIAKDKARRIEATALIARVGAWLRAAKRLMSERHDHDYVTAGARPMTTDDVIIAAYRAIRHLDGTATDPVSAEDLQRITCELQARVRGILRRRADDPAHPIRRVVK